MLLAAANEFKIHFAPTGAKFFLDLTVGYKHLAPLERKQQASFLSYFPRSATSRR